MKYSVFTKYWIITSDRELTPRIQPRKAKFKVLDSATHKETPRIPLTRAMKKVKEGCHLSLSEDRKENGKHGTQTYLSKDNYPTLNSRYYAGYTMGITSTKYPARFFDDFKSACEYQYEADTYWETHRKEHKWLSQDGCREFYELYI